MVDFDEVRKAQKSERPGAQQVALKMTLKQQILEDKRRERTVRTFVEYRNPAASIPEGLFSGCYSLFPNHMAVSPEEVNYQLHLLL